MRSHFPNIDDEALVLAALVGDMTAFDELVRRFRGAVILVARQALGSHEMAEDLAQEALLLAFKALPQLDDPARFPAWLCAITRRCAWRAAAREQRCRPYEPSALDRLLLAQSHELAVNPAQVALDNEQHRCLRSALAGIAPEHRIVLQLHYYQEWPVARIADFLSLPLTTVKWRMHQGRRLLCRRLTDMTEEKDDDSGQ